MAASQANTSSTICDNSQLISDASHSQKAKSTFLYLLEDNLFWEGDLESLKMFFEADLQINGRWSSPRGETTQFSNPDFCLKWLGPTDKKLTIVQDNDENHLQITLKSYAILPKSINDQIQNSEIEHVPDVVVVDEADKKVAETKDENYDQYGHHREEIDKLLFLMNEIKQKQDKDRQINECKAAKTDAEIKSLVQQNKKMAAEIKSLNTINEELRNDNAIIRCAFEIKQGEWTKIEHAKSGDKKRTEAEPVPNINRYQSLPDETTESVDSGVQAQISDYRANQQAKFQNSRSGRRNPKQPKLTKAKTNSKPTKPSRMNIDLVIGDSMVKNIDSKKLERAAKQKNCLPLLQWSNC